MAGENTVSTLNGLFKTVYADKLLDLVPDYAILQKKIPFVSADKETGNFYAQPVNLSHEQGFTYNGDAGNVVSLNAAINGTMKEAQVKGTEMILRTQITYTALSRASKAGPKAFKRASAWKVEDMNNSMRKRLEVSMLYGQVGIGVVDSIVSASGSGTITLTAASWAGGIWAGAENAKIDSFATLSSAATNSADITITAVNSDTRTLSVTCTGNLSSNTAANDILFFKGTNSGSGTFTEMAGLQKIISNSSTLFNINAGTYSLWKGNTVSSVGQLTHAKVQDALARAVNKGLMDPVLLLVSPKGFNTLNADLAALRMFDSSYGGGTEGKNGFEKLLFHSVNGPVEVVSHPLVKDGDAFIVPLDSVMRLGSVDLSFGVPGMDETFFTLVAATNAVELQCMADQAIFLEKPAHAVYLSGITYT